MLNDRNPAASNKHSSDYNQMKFLDFPSLTDNIFKIYDVVIKESVFVIV